MDRKKSRQCGDEKLTRTIDGDGNTGGILVFNSKEEANRACVRIQMEKPEITCEPFEIPEKKGKYAIKVYGSGGKARRVDARTSGSGSYREQIVGLYTYEHAKKMREKLESGENPLCTEIMWEPRASTRDAYNLVITDCPSPEIGTKKECFDTKIKKTGEWEVKDREKMRERIKSLKECGADNPKPVMDFEKNKYCVSYDDTISCPEYKRKMDGKTTVYESYEEAERACKIKKEKKEFCQPVEIEKTGKYVIVFFTEKGEEIVRFKDAGGFEWCTFENIGDAKSYQKFLEEIGRCTDIKKMKNGFCLVEIPCRK